MCVCLCKLYTGVAYQYAHSKIKSYTSIPSACIWMLNIVLKISDCIYNWSLSFITFDRKKSLKNIFILNAALNVVMILAVLTIGNFVSNKLNFLLWWLRIWIVTFWHCFESFLVLVHSIHMLLEIKFQMFNKKNIILWSSSMQLTERCPFVLKLWSQRVHLNGRSPVWIRMWDCKCPIFIEYLSQIVHFKYACVSRCTSSSLSVANVW